MCQYTNTRFICGDNLNTLIERCPKATPFLGACVDFNVNDDGWAFCSQPCPGCNQRLHLQAIFEEQQANTELQQVIYHLQQINIDNANQIQGLKECLTHLHTTNELSKSQAKEWAKNEAVKQGVDRFDNKYQRGKKNFTATGPGKASWARFPSQDITVKDENTPVRDSFLEEEVNASYRNPPVSVFKQSSRSTDEAYPGATTENAEQGREGSRRGQSI